MPCQRTQSLLSVGFLILTLAGNVSGAEIRGGPITPEERQLWSLQPIEDKTPPHIESKWARNAIDAFILDALEERGMQPVGSADKRTLIRRVTYDLIGLPPTPDEVEAFVADDTPSAFKNVVERLLRSSHYGEHWGRHWLDVVRYADTAGETGDYPVRFAYKYRNWVINAHNADMPYDEFVRLQLAGDLIAARANQLSPEDYANHIVATGFIAISRRFGFDVENYHYLTIQDTLDTLSQSVLGLTLGCARCHDHKYDPVNADDYYALYGIFESTKYSFPGSEEKKRPYDMVPLTPPGAEQTAIDHAYGAFDGEPKDARIHKRGDHKSLGETVARRNLTILGGDRLPEHETGSGRLQLAEWFTRTDNPLTARVMVNRLWQKHFGQGLVRTENDFGARGERPTHPELLDWLASRFIESGWSMKTMHRLIVNSATYQLASIEKPDYAEIDPEDRFLWRFPRRRLSAEEYRDSVLYLSGQLALDMGGEHPFPAEDTWGFTQHAPYYGVYKTNTRSVYLMQQRLKRHPFLALFDGADPNVSTAERLITTTPTQALYLMNSPFVHDNAMAFAVKSARLTKPDLINSAHTAILGRKPTSEEIDAGLTFLKVYTERLADSEVAQEARSREALAAYIRTLFVRNEFLFVD